MPDEIVGTEGTPAGEPTQKPDEDDTSQNEDAETLKAEAEKWRQTAENYRKENEKFRIQEKEKRREELPKPTGEAPDIQRDFISKRADVLYEMEEELKKLGENEWGKIKHLVDPATNRLLEGAVKENRYVAAGEIRREVKELVAYAQIKAKQAEDLEKARLEGAQERDNLESAEISGVSSAPRPKEAGVLDEDRQKAQERKTTPEFERDLRLKREAREKDYAPSDNLSKYL